MGPLPALGNGCVTFACLNRLIKVTTGAVAVWAGILRRVPDSRLLLLLGGNAAGSSYLSAQFQAHGVEAARVEFVGRLDRRHYFERMRRVDVALDPFPYNGGVTTCDLLWMGVPVVTLEGDVYWSRQGTMLLRNVGEGRLVARTPRQYEDVAVELASDLPALAELRRGLRARVARSPLCDAPAFARALEEAYQSMWQAAGARARGVRS